MLKKLLATGAAAAVFSAFAAMPASALPFSVIDSDGTTNFEDDSGEFVLRPVTENGEVVDFEAVTGELQEGDRVAGVLAMTSIGGHSLETLNTEVTGLFLTQLDDITSTGQTTRDGVTFERGDLTFTDASDFFDEVFGIASQDEGTVARLYEDTANNLNLLGPAADQPSDRNDAIAKASDGDLFGRFEMDELSNFLAFDVPLDVSTFGAVDDGTQLGVFDFDDLLIAEYFGPGVLLDNRTSGSGNLFSPLSTDNFPVEDDLQFTVQIPIPQTIGLLGIGLIGLGVAARRRKRA